MPAWVEVTCHRVPRRRLSPAWPGPVRGKVRLDRLKGNSIVNKGSNRPHGTTLAVGVQAFILLRVSR